MTASWRERAGADVQHKCKLDMNDYTHNALLHTIFPPQLADRQSVTFFEEK